MLFEYKIITGCEDFYDISSHVRQAILNSDIENGIALVYCPHYTSVNLTRQGAESFI